MKNVLPVYLAAIALALTAPTCRTQEKRPAEAASSFEIHGTGGEFQASLPRYRVRLAEKTALGQVPALEIYLSDKLLFRFPLIAGLDSATEQEHLSNIQFTTRALAAGKSSAQYEIVATAASSLWTRREFQWRLYSDHLEFSQAAWGDGKIGRCYFFSNGRPGRWDKGRSDGAAWNSTLMPD